MSIEEIATNLAGCVSDFLDKMITIGIFVCKNVGRDFNQERIQLSFIPFLQNLKNNHQIPSKYPLTKRATTYKQIPFICTLIVYSLAWKQLHKVKPCSSQVESFQVCSSWDDKLRKSATKIEIIKNNAWSNKLFNLEINFIKWGLCENSLAGPGCKPEPKNIYLQPLPTTFLKTN